MPGSSPDRPPPRHHRLRVAEAIVLLLLARACVAFLRFGTWRRWVGKASPCVDTARHASAPNPISRACTQAVERAALRLPGSLCLPQAMALQWMLRRRQQPSTIVLGAAAGQDRGSVNMLHAWVEQGGTILLGDSGGVHRPVLQLG